MLFIVGMLYFLFKKFKNLLLDTRHDDKTPSPPPPPPCTPPGGCDPKNSSRIEISIPKNLPLDILHDDIGGKIKILFPPPLPPPPMYAPRGV